MAGLDHLLPNEKTPSEAKVACFMGLLSLLAAKPEVLRISPLHRVIPMNAVSRAVVQSATLTDTPLLDAGLDGTGEVIQVRRPNYDRRYGLGSCLWFIERVPG